MAEKETALQATTLQLSEIEEELVRLENAAEDVWQRPAAANDSVLPIVPRTRFVSIINLKGGVGKTTLTANLAATLALEYALRVLIVDLDFQATLSDMAVEHTLFMLKKAERNTVSRLLAPDCDFQQLAALAVPMHTRHGRDQVRVRVIVADDDLEREDFRGQIAFLRDHTQDVRLRFRSVLRRPDISQQYDLVIFDCPPRFTTSAVNALACSDYFLIPTKLDPKSVNAVPRTLKRIGYLSAIAQPRLLGVVANEVGVGQHLTAQEAIVYDNLPRSLRIDYGPNAYVFTKWVKRDRDIAQGSKPGMVPALNARVRNLFKPVAKEFKERLGL